MFSAQGSVEAGVGGNEAEFACGLADAARAIALRYYRHWNGLELKGDRSPVTLADQDIERMIREAIEGAFPGDGIFGEETGVTGRDNDRLWVVDPIDGTGSFATGNPLFGVLIGFWQAGSPQIGIIDACATGERWVAVRDQGVSMNGQACRTSGRRELSGAAISCTSIHDYGEDDLRSLRRVASKAAVTRLGGDCYAYGLVALGHLDAVIESGLMPYDYLPLVPVIEEAGGVITDWNGQPLTVASEGRIVAAASPELHSHILGLL